MRHPTPSYAVAVWFNGDSISVAREGQGPEGHGSTVCLPATADGMKVLLLMLKERNAATSSPDLHIGTSATPTQYEIDRNRGAASFFRLVREEREERKALKDAEAAEKAERAALRAKRQTRQKIEAKAALEALGLRKKVV